jgi:hypothetical protein
MDAPTGIKALVGRKQTKNVKFVGEDVTITKLTVAQVKAVQEAAKALDVPEGTEADDDAGLNVLRTVIRSSVNGGEQLTDEDFEGFPIDELRNLSKHIMTFSGIGGDEGKSN